MTASDIFRQLVAVFNDWQGILKDPQYVRNDDEITWSGANPSILPVLLTKQDTAVISRNGQYSFRITEDDSVIQINYRFLREGGLQSARLAFYEVGTSLDEQEIAVYPSNDSDELIIPAKWVRFDYCETGRRRVLHMDSHLHISGLPGVRFPVAGIPTPKQFMEFVISHFYPATYQKYRLDNNMQFQSYSTIDSINSDCIDPQHDMHVYQRIAHLRIPNI